MTPAKREQPAAAQKATRDEATETSHSLLAMARADDPEAWERLVSLYSPLIYYWCRSMQLPEQDMADVFQETFQSVARKIKDFKHHESGGTFRGWLRTVTRNKVLDHYRRKGVEPRPEGGTEMRLRLEQVPFDEDVDSELVSTAADNSEKHAYTKLFQETLERIRPHFNQRTWQAFWKVCVEGLETSEVAALLEMKPGNVRVAKSRVLNRIRQELGDLPE